MKLTAIGSLKIADCSSPSDIREAQEVKTDIIRLSGSRNKDLYAPESIRWIGMLDGYSNTQQFLRNKESYQESVKARSKLSAQGWSFSVNPLTEALFQEFSVLYKNEVASRDRIVKVNLVDQTMGKLNAGYTTVVIGAYQGSKLRAAIIGFIKRNNLFVTVGAKERVKGVKGGLGGILEIMLLDYCFENDIFQIYHGITLNPSGIISSPGLFEFKARYGYTAFPHGYWRTFTITNPTIITNDLVLLTIISNNLAYKIITYDSTDSAIKKYKTRDISTVQQLSSKDFIKLSRNALSEFN